MRTRRMLFLSAVAVLFVGAECIAESPAEKSVAQQRQYKLETQQPLARMAETTSTVGNEKIIAATNVYKAILKTDKGEVPRTVLDKARCIAVFPGVVSGAAVIGGSRGSGIAVCRDPMGKWSKPAFLDITSASVGVQLGGKTSDMAFFMLTDQAATNLKNGNIVLGADATTAVGSYAANWDTGTASVVAYELSEGGMLGISLNGTTMTKNEPMNNQFYGRTVDYLALLDNRENVPTNNTINSFISLLPTGKIIK